MSTETKAKAIAEACRVLKKDGRLVIWDSEIKYAYPKAFSTELEIALCYKTIHTEYGILGIGVEQNADMIIKMCSKSGVRLFEHEEYSESFKLVFIK